MNFLRINILIVVFVASVLNVFAQDFDTVKKEADLAFMDGKHEAALNQYKSIMNSEGADSTDLSMVYGYAGMCSTELNQNKAAIEYFKKALELKAPQLMIYDNLISLAKDEKDNKTYEFALLKKKEEFPDFEAEIIQKLSYLYYNTKRYEKLLEVTSVLVEWYPNNSKYHLFDAVAKQNLKMIDKAEVAYKKVLELDPSQAGANMGMGMILYNRADKQYDKIKAEYEAIPKPSRVDYSNFRKNIEQPKTTYKEALKYLLKAYENKSYKSLKGVIRSSYLRLEDKVSADQYL